jgi:hypothetical protein
MAIKNSFIWNLEVWIWAGISAAISGGASSISALIVDPKTFNIHEGLGKVFEMFGTAATVNIIFYLAKSPLPKLPESNENTSVTPTPPPATP